MGHGIGAAGGITSCIIMVFVQVCNTEAITLATLRLDAPASPALKDENKANVSVFGIATALPGTIVPGGVMDTITPRVEIVTHNNDSEAPIPTHKVFLDLDLNAGIINGNAIFLAASNPTLFTTKAVPHVAASVYLTYKSRSSLAEDSPDGEFSIHGYKLLFSVSRLSDIVFFCRFFF